MNSFTDLPLLPKIQESLDALGFTQMTEVQAKVIPFLLQNPRSDVHAQAQTGTGKTLAFGIPLVQSIDPSLKAVQALIVAPTRELVLQIYENLVDISRHTGISIESIYGGMPINRQITNIQRGAHIIVGTPGRLNDHLRRKTLNLKSLKVLVLDEADIMLDMGFKGEIDSILACAPERRAIWLFSATVLSGIKDLIKSHMNNVFVVRVAPKEVVNSQVKQYFCVVPQRSRLEATARFIEATPDFYGIIFCRTKDLTSEVMEQLASRGFKVNCLHGDMKQTLRNQVIKGFKQRDFNVLVATDVAARGIDVADLTHVINYSIPDEPESYVHRIGRTGRGGKEGSAILFVLPSEVYRLKQLERMTHITLQEISVPPLEAIINAKIGAVSDFIEQAKRPLDSKLSSIHKALDELIQSFSSEEIRNSLLVALEDKFFKDLVHENLEHIKPSSEAVRQEICMELGTKEGFSEDMVRDYLIRVGKLLPQELFKVRVLNEKTFIAIPENRLKDCLHALKTEPLTSKKHKVYLVQDTYKPGGEKSSRSRRGGFGDKRKKRMRKGDFYGRSQR